MMKKDVCKVLVLMICMEVVCCKLPSQQVSAITSVFDIIQNHTGRSFVRYYTPKTKFLKFVWTRNSNPCLWSGVYCNPDYSSIINVSFAFSEFGISSSEFIPFLCNITTLESVDVSGNHLGSIPDGFLSGCGNIKHLDFSWNWLDGPLPSLNGFKMLEYLDLSRNSLSGEISDQLDGLVSLKFLNLSHNEFRGRIPANLGKLNLMEELMLTENSLSGGIPTWISNITTLRVFDAGFNYLNGSIPSGITSHLSSLSLVLNKLTGRIPSDLLSGPYLEYVELSGNELEGPIPAINSTTLIELGLRRNDLNGTIPWDSLGTLEYLFLSDNRLTGTLPPVLGNHTNLQVLLLDWNDFVGAIPPEISHLNLLTYLRIFRNSLNGSIPDSIGNLSSLKVLQLGDNQLSGPIPDSIRNLSSLRELQLGDNRLIGRIPDMPESLQHALNLSFNLFHGSIPVSLSRLVELRVLDLHANNLHGPIPDSIGNLSSLEYLHLENNQLGHIPNSIGNLSFLWELQLGNNRLSGRIPDMPESLWNALNLSYNLLDGKIPDSLSRLVSLKVLDLQANNLHGPIPNTIRRLSSLEYLHLGDNQLSGPIPNSIGNLSSLEYLHLGDNQLSGPIPNTIRRLSSLTQLQLANNQLTTPIPYMPGTMQIALNLSYNLFSGPIPDALSNLWQLGVLDLSNNRFSGQIPDFLTHFSGLNHLLLINNNLSGVIPTFPNDVKVDTWGNPNLIEHIENPSPTLPHRKKKSIHPHFFIAAATGFPVGLLISIIAIFISRRYHTIHGILSTPNTIHKPIIHFNKAMQAVSDPSNITVKATFSTFYKFVMPSGTTYLVKRFNHTNKIFQFPRHKELVEELEVLGELSNPNIMIPVGYLLTTRRAYLFYDFVRGTLYDILHHRMGCRLDWPSRFTIAVGVSKGLAFLHECTCGPIILLDLCSKSILLKSMDVPQISDIELCSLMHSSKTKECMAALDASSVGYVPPEYGSTKRVTAAGNVYSFGVVLLELVTGKPAVSEGSELAKRVLSISEQGNGWDEILDSSVSETSVGVRNQMVAVVKVALACINISPEMRPNSATVLQMLQNRL